MTVSKPHSVQDDFEIVRQGLVRDGHDRFAALRRIEEQYQALREAATALYERVEMDESVGICLSTRAESMALGALLSNPAMKLCDREGCGNPVTRYDAWGGAWCDGHNSRRVSAPAKESQ
jgi:hypothetical protein